MAINFPNSPSNGQIFTSSGRSYEYNSTAGVWNRKEQTAAAVPSDVSDLTDTGGLLGSGGATVYADMAALIAATGMSSGDQAYVTANNKLYFYNGSGWYLIATVQNDAPSAITGVNGTYELAIDGTATTITAVSTDPEGFPLTWSYSTSGLGSIATVSNTDGVFTITPSTTEADAGTFTLTINATDGVNGAVNTSTDLTLNFIVIVTNSKYTTLLATAVDTSDNNNITDSSSNNNSITVNGDSTAGTFSPYRSGGYSTYFGNGGSERITVEGTKYTLAGANADFSISAWIYPTAGNDKWIYSTNDANHIQAGWHDLYLEGSTKLVWRHSDGSTHRSMMSTNPVSLNEWSYVLINRTSSVTYMYINGSLVAQNSDMTNALYTHTNAPSIGIRHFYDTNAASLDFEGYIADVHVKTAAISSPTTVATERAVADNDTWLLTCHLPYFKDGSTSNYTVSVGGTPYTKPFSPYDYIEYAAADHGGSIVINSTSAWVESTVTAPSTGSFAVECWVYWDEFPNTSNGGNQSIISFKGSEWAAGIILLYQNPTGGDFAVYANDSWFMVGSSVSQLKVKVWYHAAITFDGTNLRLFVNGSLIDTKAFSTDLTNTELRIGNDGWWSMGPGKVSDVRYTRGSAVYTADFTPPTAPLSSSGAELHIKGTDASIIDKAQNSNLLLHGNTTGSTTQAKFSSTKSMYFDGTGDYITIDADEIPDLGAEDWTIETWFYTSNLSADFWLISQGDNGNNLPFSRFKVKSDGGTQMLTYSGGNLPINLHTTAGEVTANTWHHIALTHEYNGSNGGTWRVYIDGSKSSVTIGNDTYTSGYYWNSAGVTGKHWEIAKDVSETSNISPAHYLQDFRITKGRARYTAADETSNIPSAPLEG